MWKTARGGCHCGFVRYEVREKPRWAGYCHCRTCQRTTGAPAVVWAQVPAASFGYTAGEPSVYRSSETGERRFCPHCGGQIEFRQPKRATIEFYAATLDDPALIEPTMHIFTAERIAWFATDDQLPRFTERPNAAG